MSQPHILFVDDDQLLHAVIKRLLNRHGITVTSCLRADQAMKVLKEETFDLVLTDFVLPDVDGVELLGHVRQEFPSLKVIMMTGHAEVQHAVHVMRAGAIDYIPKPFSTTELVERVQKCLESEAPSTSAPKTGRKPGRPPKRKKNLEYVGEHSSIDALRRMLPIVATNEAPVFIQGESGTGKEILARLIHQLSNRAGGPFVAINCATLPRELAESHLFGHRKGAFTGAVEDMTGAFESAEGGTLLLDEITEVAPGVQAKLLRVLQEREFQKVGAARTQKADVRIVATSNRSAKKAIDEGVFREDLYHRLSVFPLIVPPLRDRRSDIPLLAAHFADKYCALYGLPEKTISVALGLRLFDEAWPGNVRELENAVQRGVILSADRSEIGEDDVWSALFRAGSAQGRGDGHHGDGLLHFATLDEMERHMILQALDEMGGNQLRTAERLGVSDRTIRNKLKRYRDEGLI